MAFGGSCHADAIRAKRRETELGIVREKTAVAIVVISPMFYIYSAENKRLPKNCFPVATSDSPVNGSEYLLWYFITMSFLRFRTIS